jgi:hypothetical protein
VKAECNLLAHTRANTLDERDAVIGISKGPRSLFRRIVAFERLSSSVVSNKLL